MVSSVRLLLVRALRPRLPVAAADAFSSGRSVREPRLERGGAVGNRVADRCDEPAVADVAVDEAVVADGAAGHACRRETGGKPLVVVEQWVERADREMGGWQPGKGRQERRDAPVVLLSGMAEIG